MFLTSSTRRFISLPLRLGLRYERIWPELPPAPPLRYLILLSSSRYPTVPSPVYPFYDHSVARNYKGSIKQNQKSSNVPHQVHIWFPEDISLLNEIKYYKQGQKTDRPQQISWCSHLGWEGGYSGEKVGVWERVIGYKWTKRLKSGAMNSLCQGRVWQKVLNENSRNYRLLSGTVV